jgi:ankyrin repeat protein
MVEERLMNYLDIVMPLMGLVLFAAPLQAEGIKKTEPLYDDKDIAEAIILQPEKNITKRDGLFGTRLLSPGNYGSVSIFPVPFDNAVGTNDMGNALTVISFHKGKLSYKRYFKDAVYDVCCGGNYMSEAVPGLVGFGQAQRFVLFDLKRNAARTFSTSTIEKIVVADADKLHFILGDNHSTELVDLSGKELKVIKKIPDPLGVIWSAGKDRIFQWEYEAKRLSVLDLNLEPAHHPLEEVIAKHKDKIGFMRIALHPHLPFAILYNGIEGNIVIHWDKNRKSPPRVAIYDGEDFSFSPDGKWVVYKTGNIGQDPQTYMHPVSEKYSHYLGSPILLSDTYFNHHAWTTNPTAFVGSHIESLLRWDLENADYPGKGQKSFHEYVVQKDLEHLARKEAEGTPFDKTRHLIASKTDLNAKDNKGHTALMRAAMYGHADAVKLLIAAGANVQIKDGFGDTAFCFAAVSGHSDVVKLLMPTAPDLSRGLKDAATGGHSDIVKRLLAAGAKVNSGKGMESPLSESITWRHAKVVKLLIAAGADVNARFGYDKNDTPLKTAIDVDRPDIVKMLIAAKANVNEKYYNGETALMHAVAKDHVEIVKLLLAAGADVNKSDGNDTTALVHAVRENYKTDLIKLLIKAKANVNKRNRDGANAVLYAAKYSKYAGGNEEILNLLIKAGAKE